MIQSALKNPHVIVVIALATIIIGVTSYNKIPADLLPIFKTPAVQIVTFYPGMPPEIMERDIMSRLERWTGQSIGISHQEGKAMLGVSIVKDFFREGISMDTAMSQVTSFAVSDMYYLPPGTVPPMVMPFDPTASVPLCVVSISSPAMNEQELYDIAYFELRNRLQSIQGVIAPAVYGGKLRRILAYVDREKLESRGLSPMDIVNALQEQNVFIPAGNMKAGDMDYQIFANTMPVRVEELNDIPVAFRSGSPIFLRDIGTANDASQIQSNVVRVNGKRQVYIPIYRQPGANTIQIVDAIKNNLNGIVQRLRNMDPRAKDLALEVVLDQSVYVRSSLESLQTEGLLGAGFAALVVLLFLRRLRSTIIVLIPLPLAVLATMTGLYYAGATLNAMTIGGLALVIGILIDQSIVVVEAIVRHIEEGEPPYTAALNGSREVAMPMLIATVTFCVVFFPVTFLSGMASFLFSPLALAATAAMIVSYLFSITLVPVISSRFLKASSGHAASHHGNVGGLTRLYLGLARGLITVRWLVVLAVIGLFAGTIPLLLSVGSELFPQVEAGQFQILVRMPTGTRIEKTEDMIAQIETVVVNEMGEPDPTYPAEEKQPDSNLKMLISNIGVLMDWPAAYTPNSGSMDAFMLVQLKNKEGLPGTFEYVTRLREKLRAMFPAVEFSFDTGGMLTAALNMGEPSPIHFQISGSKLETSYQIATRISQIISKVEGTADVRIAQRLDYPIVDLEIDRAKAAYAGLTVEDVIKNVVTATNSSIGFDPAFWIDEKSGNHYFIGAQYSEHDLVSLDTLRNIPVTGSQGKAPVPLRSLASFKRKTGPSVVNHKNITRVIDVYSNILPGYNIGSVVSEMEKQLMASPDIQPVPQESDRGAYFEIAGSEFAGKGYRYTLSGEVATMRESFEQFAGGLLLAVLLVYLVMVIQFRAFTDPFIVLLTVPLGMIGVALMLYFTGTALSIMAAMGIIMMVGLVVSYSILLVDYANSQLAQGMSLRSAIIIAAQVRVRPILMTSMAAVLALAPMAYGGPGAEANAPLARAITGGVLGAASLSLLVVPCLYVLLKREPGKTA